MPMQDQPCEIGEMRWSVTLAYRREDPDLSSSNLVEEYIKVGNIHAKITPTASEIFIGGAQNGAQITTPITHEIIIRWQPYVNVTTFDTIIRKTVLPDGRSREELFRIRQIKEWNGRHRFIICDVELETAT
jgi:Phage head-tail joining protein